MQNFDGPTVQCEDCGAHFQIDPAGEVQNAACSECGGKRFFRFQPNPTKGEMDGDFTNQVMNMPGAAGSDTPGDPGGSPLTEGLARPMSANWFLPDDSDIIDDPYGRETYLTTTSSKIQEDERLQLRSFRQTALAETPEGNENSEIEFPTVQDAVDTNRASLEGFGQTNHNLLRPEVLEGALGRAPQYWNYTRSIPQTAAAIAHGVGQAQAFEDGNKRTAYWLTHGFLHNNGYAHMAPEDDHELARHLIGYGEGTHTFDDTANMFENRLNQGSVTASYQDIPQLLVANIGGDGSIYSNDADEQGGPLTYGLSDDWNIYAHDPRGIWHSTNTETWPEWLDAADEYYQRNHGRKPTFEEGSAFPNNPNPPFNSLGSNNPTHDYMVPRINAWHTHMSPTGTPVSTPQNPITNVNPYMLQPNNFAYWQPVEPEYQSELWRHYNNQKSSKLADLQAPGLDDGEVDVHGIPIRRDPGTLAPDSNANNMDLAKGVAGFPLSEGTIVGDDGEPNPYASTHGYDGYTHSHVAAVPFEQRPDDQNPYQWQSGDYLENHNGFGYRIQQPLNPQTNMFNGFIDMPGWNQHNKQMQLHLNAIDSSGFKRVPYQVQDQPQDFEHPDPGMDSEPGTTTFPEDWNKQANSPYDPIPNEMYPDDQMSGKFLGPNGETILVPKPYGSDGGNSPAQIDYTDVTHIPGIDINPEDFGTPHQGRIANTPVKDAQGTVIRQGSKVQDPSGQSGVVSNFFFHPQAKRIVGVTAQFPNGEVSHQVNPDYICPSLKVIGDQMSLFTNHNYNSHNMETFDMDPYPALWSDEHVGGLFDDVAQIGLGIADPDVGVGELAAKAAPTIMKSLGIGGKASPSPAAGGAPAGMQTVQAPTMQQLGSVDIPMLIVADLETPGAVKSVDEQHDDPEKQDQKEFNDGDKSPSNFHNPNNEDSGASGEDGVRDATPGYGFGPNSPGIQHMLGVLPLLVHYLTNGLTAEDDPIINDLHDKLESEQPGYLDHEHPDGPNVVKMIIEQHGKKQSHRLADIVPAVPMPASSLGDVGSYGSDVVPIQQKAQHCPHCGSTVNGDGSCPNCQFPQAGTGIPNLNHTSNHQGPVTPEQFEACQQWLESNGKADLVQQLYENPENFGWLINEIQNNPQPTAPLVDPGQSQPPPPQENPAGAMPMGDPSVPGGGAGQLQPMSGVSDLSTLQDIANLRQNLPTNIQRQIDDLLLHQGALYTLNFLKRMQWGQNNVIAKTADANNIVPRCPNCGSATTTLLDGNDNGLEGRSAHCHSCNKNWKLPDKMSRLVALANPVLNPQEIWSDTDGNPIQQGQEYSLYTAGVPVPDEVTVIAKKPDELTLLLAGTSADFTIKASDMGRKYSLEPATNTAASQTPDPHNNGPLDNANVIEEPTTDQIVNSYPNQATSHVEENADICRKCGSADIHHSLSSPESTLHECYRCFTAWETHNHEDFDYGENGREYHNSKLDWIKNDSDDDFFADMARHQAMRNSSGMSRNIRDIANQDPRLQQVHEILENNAMTREAGKHFTQSEKRELIDEEGHARNFANLDLSNTHYVNYDRIAKDHGNGLDVDDSHFLLGLSSGI